MGQTKMDGFSALLELGRRFDTQNSATLLQALLEVVVPPKITKLGDVIIFINRWEARAAALRVRYEETLSEKMKLALLIGMLPQDFQDTIIQSHTLRMDEMKYDDLRTYVMGLANQKMNMMKPTPMDIGKMENGGEFGKVEEQGWEMCEGWEEEGWGEQAGAPMGKGADWDVNAATSSMQCYACGGMELEYMLE